MKEVTIYGNPPSKSNMYRAGSYCIYKTPALTAYENQFFIQCGKYRDLNIDGYFKLHIDVYYPSQRSDLDNALKAVLDILQVKVKAIKNDNLCTEIIARKFVDKVKPRIEFTIEKV